MELGQITGFDLQLNGIRRRYFSRDFPNGQEETSSEGARLRTLISASLTFLFP
jgi:hypothetical protein